MLSFLVDIVAGVLATSILALNGLFYFLERLFQGKVGIDPGKHVVVVTGCDSGYRIKVIPLISIIYFYYIGFGEMISIKLVKMGFKVVSGCLTQTGVDMMKATVSSIIMKYSSYIE